MRRGTVLVTGASAGLGAEFARQVAAEGARVVLVARRAERLAGLAAELAAAHGTETRVEAVDLAVPGASAALVARLAAAGWSPDLAILNAGFGLHGAFTGQTPARLIEMVALNCAAPTELAAALAPELVARGRGGLLFVASLAAFQPMGGFAVYAATKAFVLSLAEALSIELGASGIHVSAFCPGPVPTEFRSVAGSPAKRSSLLDTVDAASAVRAALAGHRAGRIVVVQPRWRGLLVPAAAKLLPRAWLRRVAARFG